MPRSLDSLRKRLVSDVRHLMKSGHQVKLHEDRMHKFFVKFNGPQGSLYEGGVWKIKVELSEGYPILSPSLNFVNYMFHPNVDERTGSICVDVMKENWNYNYDLVAVFDFFLPLLLKEPNPSNPLNVAAASLLLQDEHGLYRDAVKEACIKYAKPEDVFMEKSDHEKK